MNYNDEENDGFKFLYDRKRYDSYYGKEELGYAKTALLLMESGFYEIVEAFEKAKIEKERVELEKRKKDLGLD